MVVMRKKAVLITLLFSALTFFAVFPHPIESTPAMYTPSTHGSGGL